MKVKKPSKKMIVALAIVIAGISIASYFGVTNAAGSDLPETILREYPVPAAILPPASADRAYYTTAPRLRISVKSSPSAKPW